MAKLSPDYIKLVLTMDSSQLQKEFQKVSESYNQLSDKAKGLQSRMRELESQGLANSDEWRNLNKELKNVKSELSICDETWYVAWPD